MTSETTRKFTSSPESADGPMPFGSPDGPTTGPFGREAAPANPFRALDDGAEQRMDAMSGPLFSASSPSAALQSSLESRLRQTLDASGSPEYVLTWNQLAMPLGAPILQRQALARRTFGNAFSGWGTPMERDYKDRGDSLKERPTNEGLLLAGYGTPRASDGDKPQRTMEGALSEAERRSGNNELPVSAMLVGEQPTPSIPCEEASPMTAYTPIDLPVMETADSPRTAVDTESAGTPTSATATPTTKATPEDSATLPLAGYPTPTAANADGSQLAKGATTTGKRPDGSKATVSLHSVVKAIGPDSTSSAQTETPKDGARLAGSLNPAFSLWLMGFPAQWMEQAPSAESVRSKARGTP